MTEMVTAPPESETTDFLSRPLFPSIGLDWEKAIYILFIILAIVTRFYALGDRVMSHDESLHTQFSYQFFNGDGYSHTPLMHGPLLFHATAISYWLFGDSDFSARVPVAILGVLLVAMPYFLRNWLGKTGALVTSFLFLISPYLTYYSRYIRHDIYIIVWALIVFTAMWYFMREAKNKYLWWFVVGLALMFATKEVAFIYVAIFGGFLVLRLLVKLAGATWIRDAWPRLRLPILVALIGVLLIGGGFGVKMLTERVAVGPASELATEGFAADPSAANTAGEIGTDGPSPVNWALLAGVALLSAGLFLTVRSLRPQIDGYAEFDLIILLATLILPFTAPFLVNLAGWNPQDGTLNLCVVAGQESMNALQLLLARTFNPECISSYMQSGVVRTNLFLVATLIVSILVGLWWDIKRWPIAAGIFFGIVLILFTSVFTNPPGWRTGIIGSLGYWLEQQGVQRGSQPWYYYFIVTPLYEFLVIIFALAGAYLWTRKERINKIVWYWVMAILASLLAYSLANWFFNRGLEDITQQSQLPGLLAAAAVFLMALAYWFLLRRKQIIESYGLAGGLVELVDLPAMVSFIPSVILWSILTWLAYSLAGEKMPWLSTHFVIPMAMLSGWYINERLAEISHTSLRSSRTLLGIGLSALLIIVGLLALGPLLLGQVNLGDQQLASLSTTGRFLGGLLLMGLLFYAVLRVMGPMSRRLRSFVAVLAVFSVLSLLTIRFAYMASFVNGDSTTEFMVYAHGAPATKDVVMNQVEELSMRLNGDKSINVAYDSDVSWPFTWYLRDYPQRVFFGENPSNSLRDSPVVIVGNRNWDKAEPFLANDFVSRDYTFLWWPMQQYMGLTWESFLGNPNDEIRRGLGNPDVRQALWDIFFYRDYTRYGEVFGGTYTAGQWPLKHDLRLYIRKDVLADLWDYGVGAPAAAALADPYEANALDLQPAMVLNESGVAGSEPGALAAPRNIAIDTDGTLFVADSGNHRIQVFDASGEFVKQWGNFGDGPGQFNEPWGIAVDDGFVYVADTWNHRVQKFTHEGELVDIFGLSGSPSGDEEDGGLGMFFGPRDVILLPNDQLLVTDTGNHRLQVMDRVGNFISQTGSLGSLPGQFNEPVGLTEGVDGSIYVADTWNGRVQLLSPQLLNMSEFRIDAWYGQSINNKPYLATDSNGRIYMTDPEGYQVLIFSPGGVYLNRFGDFATDTSGFGLPNGIAIDSQNNVYVVDSGNNRVLKYVSIYDVGQPELDAAEDAQSPGGE